MHGCVNDIWSHNGNSRSSSQVGDRELTESPQWLVGHYRYTRWNRRGSRTYCNHYQALLQRKEVKFLIPDRAMSAGTVLVMSGDAILMDHFSCLGPVDPQLYIEGKPIPTSVLSYLEQYERFVQKSMKGTLTSADLVLLQKLDAADLRQYELAAELSVRLIRDWLVRYKFKDWSKHSSTGNTVSKEEKTNRAEEVARALNDQERWGTHGRGINREVLDKLKLKIDNLESDTELSNLAKEYFWFFRDLAFKEESQSLVHNRLFI